MLLQIAPEMDFRNAGYGLRFILHLSRRNLPKANLRASWQSHSINTKRHHFASQWKYDQKIPGRPALTRIDFGNLL